MTVRPDLARLLRNPHLAELCPILEREGIRREEFLRALKETLAPMMETHQQDNAVLREEEMEYILPAIAVYRTLGRYHREPLALFRETWLKGAEAGARYLRERAGEEGFLDSWMRAVTPKDCDAGAFLFEILRFTDSETEYHVKRCPYAELCRDYGCPEILTVFCDSDDISFGSIHPRLRWGRTRTIGRGDPVCDFRFTLLPPDP